MRKILIGLVCVALVAAGGYFGANVWAKQRAEKEVEAGLAAIRSAGGTATRGAVKYDLVSRTLSVDDITVETAAKSKMSVKVGRVIATGITQPAPGQISASRIEIADAEVGGIVNLGATGAGMRISYKAPRIELADYSGPAAPLRSIDTSSAIDLMRFTLEHLIATAAASVTIPTLTVSVTGDGSVAPDSAEYVYSGIAVGNMRGGKVASTSVDRTAFTMRYRIANETRAVEGEIAKITASDFDAKVILAALAGSKAAGDAGYQSVYRQVSAGPYKLSIDNGLRLQIDALAVEEVALNPAKYPIEDLIALLPVMQRPQDQLSPRDVSSLFDVIATFYEGTRLGKVDVRGISATTPNGVVKLAALRLEQFENGRLAQFGMESLDVQTPPQEPIRIGRFALRGLNLVELMRTSAAFANLGRPPVSDEWAALLRLLDGADLAGLTVPHKGKKIEVEGAGISWGQFVGPLPSSARTKLRMTVPIDISDEDLFRRLAAAGFKAVKLDFDLGARWTESARAFALAPATIDLSDLFAASATMTVGNVTRDIFSLDPARFMFAAMLVEAGPVEIVVRDLGAIELAVTQFARDQGIPPVVARRAVLDQIQELGAALGQTNPELVPVVKAVASFIEAPRGTLTIRLSPKSSMMLMVLINAMAEDPSAALSQVRIEAAVSR
jgi:hypothetical protein